MPVLTLYFDGLCEPVNPGGWMTWGWVLYLNDDPKEIGDGVCPSKPSNTNNTAEYHALGHGLKRAIELAAMEKPERLVIRGDSNLVVHQVNKTWKCGKEHLAVLRDRCRELLAQVECPWTVEWVPREQNTAADELSRQAYVAATGKQPPERKKRGAA